jgi:thiamine-phosphate pyrophosphorylase
VILHSHYSLSAELGTGGIHLSSHVRNDPEVFLQIKNQQPKSVSTSFHSWGEILENEFPYQYVFISPVFDSISKEGYYANIYLDGAADTKKALAQQKKHCPAIVGLGGVDAGHIATLHQHGFEGAALLGAIWMAEDPVKAFEEVIKISSGING